MGIAVADGHKGCPLANRIKPLTVEIIVTHGFLAKPQRSQRFTYPAVAFALFAALRENTSFMQPHFIPNMILVNFIFLHIQAVKQHNMICMHNANVLLIFSKGIITGVKRKSVCAQRIVIVFCPPMKENMIIS